MSSAVNLQKQLVVRQGSALKPFTSKKNHTDLTRFCLIRSKISSSSQCSRNTSSKSLRRSRQLTNSSHQRGCNFTLAALASQREKPRNLHVPRCPLSILVGNVPNGNILKAHREVVGNRVVNALGFQVRNVCVDTLRQMRRYSDLARGCLGGIEASTSSRRTSYTFAPKFQRRVPVVTPSFQRRDSSTLAMVSSLRDRVWPGLLPVVHHRSFSSTVDDSANSTVLTGIYAEKQLSAVRNASIPVQREIIVGGIAREFGFRIGSSHIQVDSVKQLLRKTETGDQWGSFYELLHKKPAAKWSNKDWDLAIFILLNRLGLKEFRAVNSDNLKAAQAFMNRSFWGVDMIPMTPSQIYAVTESDKLVGEQIVERRVKTWIANNPDGQVVAIHEGIWDGRFLMDLYIRFMKQGIRTTLVGTDINPASVALFQLYCHQILKIPREDVFIFLNSATAAITRNDLEFEVFSEDVNYKTLNIYFRVAMDLRESEVLNLFHTKASDMEGDDVLLVTIVEESPEALQALQEAKLSKESEGQFFDQYTRHITDTRESAVLLLKKGGLQGLKKHLLKKGLEVFDEQQTSIAINIGEKVATPFGASVIAFQIVKS